MRRLKDQIPVWILVAGAILTVAILIMCAEAKAGPICDPKDPKRCATPLLEGDLAPYGGQLLTPRLAIEQATLARDCKEQMDIAVSRELEIGAIRLETERKKQALDLASFQEREALLQKRLQEAHTAAERAWYESPILWATVGVIIGVGGSIAAVYAGVEITQANSK
jgi:hypothetical protein